MEHAKTLDLRERKVKTLTALGLESYGHLERLDVTGNVLKTLAGAELVGRTLKQLIASRNRLTSLAPMNTMGRLRVLNVAQNEITYLDLSGGFSKLAALVANDNKITSSGLSRMNCSLPELNTLVLSNNIIESLEGALDGLPALTKLSLSHNRLSAINLGRWRHAKALPSCGSRTTTFHFFLRT